MNTILESGFYKLLFVNSNVTDDEISNAYGEFVEMIRDYTQGIDDNSFVFRYLNLTHIEMESIQQSLSFEEKKKYT